MLFSFMIYFLLIIGILILLFSFVHLTILIEEDKILIQLYKIPIFYKKNSSYIQWIAKLIKKEQQLPEKQKQEGLNIIPLIKIKKISLFYHSTISSSLLWIYFNTLFITFSPYLYQKIKHLIPNIHLQFQKKETSQLSLKIVLMTSLWKILFIVLKGKFKYGRKTN